MTTQRLIQPPNNVPVTGEDRIVQSIWSQFFTAQVSAAAPIDIVDMSDNPTTYVASFPGSLFVANGASVVVVLQRGRVVVPISGDFSGFLPMAQGDEVEFAYGSMPDVWFIPNMGGAGGS